MTIINNSEERKPRQSIISLRPKPGTAPSPRPTAAPIINVVVRKEPMLRSPAEPREATATALPTPHRTTTDATPAPAPDADPGEVLITRGITFRNSTFGGLKVFQREYRGRTGVVLTNAAAVDMLLREHLPNRISFNAAQEMRMMSRHNGALVLQALEDRAETGGTVPGIS